MLGFRPIKSKLSSSSASRKHVSPQLEVLEKREVLYAVTGNAWVHPELITIGFVPDGSIVGSGEGGYIHSNLFATMNAQWAQATWQAEILRAAQVWAQQTNINFKLVTDDGSEIGTGYYMQGDPTKADIRIGGYNMGTLASSPLASSFMPPPVNNYSIAGDMQFNTSTNWTINQPTVPYDLFTVAMHEIGHTLGLTHNNGTSGASSSTAMWGSYTTRKTGLATDDINGIRAVTGWVEEYASSPGYGGARVADSYDLAASNGAFASASNITSTINATSKTSLITGLDITSTTDTDFFTFTVPTGMNGTLTITAQSFGLSLLAPTLTVYNSSQTQLSTTSGAGQYGTTLSSTLTVSAGQTYFVRVAGADSTAFGTGKYALTLAFAGVQSPSVPLPYTTTLNGTIGQGGGGTNNIVNPVYMMGVSDAFYPQGHDHVHEHDHAHDHSHGHNHDHTHGGANRDELRQILSSLRHSTSDLGQFARSLRQEWFAAQSNEDEEAGRSGTPDGHTHGTNRVEGVQLRPWFARQDAGEGLADELSDRFWVNVPSFGGGRFWL